MKKTFSSEAKLILTGIFWIASSSAHALSLKDVQNNPAVLMSAKTREIQALLPFVESKAAAQNLKNFAGIKDDIQKCFAQLEESESLQRAILSGAVTHPCLSMLEDGAPLNESADEFGSIARAASFQDIQGPLAQRTLKNAARTVFEYRSQFEMAKPPVNPDDSAKMKELVQSFCKGCSEEQIAAFSSEYRAIHQAHQGTTLPKMGVAELVAAQNRTIEGLNALLADVASAKSKKDDQAANAAYERYLADYQRFTATPAGAIFLTDTMKDRIHAVFTPDDFQKKFLIAGDYLPGKHQLLPPYPSCPPGTRCQERSALVLSQGLVEIEEKIADHTQRVLSAKSFEELIEADPAVVGSLLVTHPELMGQVCQAAQNVVSSENKKKSFVRGAETFVNNVDAASMGLMLAGGSGILLKAGTGVLRLGVGATSKALLKNAVTDSGRQLLKEGLVNGVKTASSERFLGTTSAKILSQTMKTGAISEAGHLLVDGSQTALAAGRQDLIVASRMARARTDADLQEISSLEKQWNHSLGSFAKGSALNALPLLGGIMKARTLLTSAKKGVAGLKDELAMDRRLHEWISKLGPKGLASAQEGIQAQALSEKNVAVGLTAVGKMSEKTQAAFAQILEQNGKIPDELLKRLNAAGGQLACATGN